MNSIFHPRVKSIFVFLILPVISAVFFDLPVCGASENESLLADMKYELLFKTDITIPGSMIQSVCVTEDYIITIENTADDVSVNDIVTAYYKNDTDSEGNPVKKYSVAGQSDTEHWEHGNSMTYNPGTGQVAVAPYTSLDNENYGCLLFMDPDTLKMTGSVKISDSYNILSITYDRENDLYYAQTDSEASYSNLVLNSDFEILEDKGAEDPAPGYNFQSSCIYGDYIIQLPLTLFLYIGNYVLLYSYEQNEVVETMRLDLDIDEDSYYKVEPEAIARLDDEEFILLVNFISSEGTGYAGFYKISFPNLPECPSLFGEEKTSGLFSFLFNDSETSKPSSEAVLTNDAQVSQDENANLNENNDNSTAHSFYALYALIPAVAAAALIFAYLNYLRILRERRRCERRIRRMRNKSRAVKQYRR